MLYISISTCELHFEAIYIGKPIYGLATCEAVLANYMSRPTKADLD